MIPANGETTNRAARPEHIPRPGRSLLAGPAWLLPLISSRERVVVLGLATGLVVLRSAVFVFFDSTLDSDQSIVGLMTKHLSEGRALPVFTYGQDYQLALEAWLAAPLFWLFGPSFLALKLPLLGINIALALLLVLLLEREMGLRPALGLLVASLFILAPPGTAMYFVEASGGQVVPLFAVLLLWLTRRRPLSFGAILAFGFLTRVFTVYALGALLVIEALDRSLFSAASIQRKLKAAVAFTAVWQGVSMVRAHAGSAWGPATSGVYAGLPVPVSDGAALNVGLLLERFCFDAESLPQRVAGFAGPFLSTMFGGHRQLLVELPIPGAGAQGVDGLWPLLGGALLLALVRVIWIAARSELRPWHPRVQFATYLMLVGTQSSVVYVASQCGEITAMTMRYTLLTILGAVGIIAYHAVVEPRRPLRRLTLGVVAVWAIVGLWGHTRTFTEYLLDPPLNNRRVLADYLVANDIRYGYADFWDVYSTVFFAEEEVILSSTSVWLIQEYEWLVQNHHDEAVWILQEPCEGGTQVTVAHYVCPQP